VCLLHSGLLTENRDDIGAGLGGYQRSRKGPVRASHEFELPYQAWPTENRNLSTAGKSPCRRRWSGRLGLFDGFSQDGEDVIGEHNEVSERAFTRR
jgi:hypothetical protein